MIEEEPLASNTKNQEIEACAQVVLHTFEIVPNLHVKELNLLFSMFLKSHVLLSAHVSSGLIISILGLLDILFIVWVVIFLELLLDFLDTVKFSSEKDLLTSLLLFLVDLEPSTLSLKVVLEQD